MRPGRGTQVATQAVDQPYGEMHRVRLIAGTWFRDGDEAQLAPQVIVNEVFWDRMGRPPLASHPSSRARGGAGEGHRRHPLLTSQALDNPGAPARLCLPPR